MKSYHIYLNDKCLFKDLNEEEFDVIWKKIYRSYWREEITYVEVMCENPTEKYMEHSY
tara:strand:- start:260 stop:433 length:174 start_codon:yes stop_codon:yes gene_type:complete